MRKKKKPDLSKAGPP